MVGPQEDDFEFKPLTSGLGFDQKTKGLRPQGSGNQNSGASNREESFGAITGAIPRGAMGFTTMDSAPAPTTSSKKDSSVAAQKVSQIISSLPSLDFLDSAPAATPKRASAPVVTQNALPRPATSSGSLLGDIPGLPKRDRQNAAPPTAQAPLGLQPMATPTKPTVAARTSASGGVAPTAQPVMMKTATPSLDASAAAERKSTLIAAAANALGAFSTTPAASKKNEVAPLIAPMPMEDRVATQPTLIETPFHMGAAIFDALVVVGLTCLFAVALLLITGTDLNIILLNARTDLATKLGIGLLVLSVFALYSIIGRAFCGMTLGEWTFDLQVGSEDEQMRAWYPLAITLRWVLLVGTGLVLFPLVSAAFGKDLLGRVTGVKLYQLGQTAR